MQLTAAAAYNYDANIAVMCPFIDCTIVCADSSRTEQVLTLVVAVQPQHRLQILVQTKLETS